MKQFRQPQFEGDIQKNVAILRGRISAADLGWFAGIIDGEGCIHIKARVRENGRGGNYHQLFIRVGNTDPRMVSKCREITTLIFGQPASTVYKKPNKPGYLLQWAWEASGDVAWAVLWVLRPYLICKGQQADVGIALQERIRQSRDIMRERSGTFHGVLNLEEIAERENLSQQMRKLNAVGRAGVERYAQYSVT